MRLFKRKAKVVEPEVEPTDPVIRTTVEKLVKSDGEVVLLDHVRVGNFVDGTVFSGKLVDENGATTGTTAVVRAQDVVRHVVVGWRNSDSTMHEMPNEKPTSLKRWQG